MSQLESNHRIVTWLKSSGIAPRGVQVQAIESGVLEGKSILVSSPTGSGKTLIGEMAMLRSVHAGCKGLYLVPLRALAHQVASNMRRRYEQFNIRIGISTGDFESRGDEISEYDILVTTYERADSLLRHSSQWMKQVGSMVVDEIQNISDRLRGPRLESVIIRIRYQIPDLQVIALSATIGWPEQLADWLDAELIYDDERPVPLLNTVSIRSDRDAGIKEFAMTTVQRNGQCLIFNRTRDGAERTAKKLSVYVGKQLTAEENEAIQQTIASLENINVPVPKGLHQCLSSGVGYHHAGLRSSARNLVEKMFRQRLIRVISATTTLASGMDLPARTVILSDVRRPDDHRKLIPANKIHQMLGRAGRPGKDRHGFGIIIAGSKGQQKEIVSKYFEFAKDDLTGVTALEPKYSPVRSHFGESSSLEEQLLIAFDQLKQATLKQIEDGLFSDSFYFHQGIRNTRSPMRLLCIDEISAARAIERHALLDTVRAARNGVLGNATIREKADDVIGGTVSSSTIGNASCRFSGRLSSSGLLEGSMCSCGYAMTKGILCEHLVILGMSAIDEHENLADHVIPLALGETSPLKRLVRMGLVEGATGKKFRITRLGSLVCRLYLRISTAAELLALLPTLETTKQLLALVRHLVGLESGRVFDASYDSVIARLAATQESMETISLETGVPVGDLYLMTDRARWLTYAIMVISDHGKMMTIRDIAMKLRKRLDSRIVNMEDTTHGDK